MREVQGRREFVFTDEVKLPSFLIILFLLLFHQKERRLLTPRPKGCCIL